MIPKKKRGFRKIMIDGITYSWRFSDFVEIRPAHNQTNRLEINFGYFDHWLYVNDKENAPEDFDPKIITPNFIRKSVLNAIRLGWDVDNGNDLKKLNYNNGIFKTE